jgi:hypothetical protein
MSLREFITYLPRYVNTFDGPRFVAICINLLNLKSNSIRIIHMEELISLDLERYSHILDGRGVSAEEVCPQKKQDRN